MSPSEFKERMKAIQQEEMGDSEVIHSRMDDLMCRALMEFGFSEGVNIFLEQEKWYA